MRQDKRSAEAVLYREWYRTPEWARIRGKRLAVEKVCRVCARQKQYDPSFVIPDEGRPVVDHVIPHRGDKALFFDFTNTQRLCAHHHNSMKQRMEKSGQNYVAIGADGWPLGERP